MWSGTVSPKVSQRRIKDFRNDDCVPALLTDRKSYQGTGKDPIRMERALSLQVLGGGEDSAKVGQAYDPGK